MRRVENNEESRPLLSSATNDTPPFYDSTVASNPSHNIRDDELELEGCAGSCCCHPTALCHRLIALALMCFLGFGSYFCYDNPGALQNEIRSTMGINTYKFAELYAWYSWPNTILPIIGGYLMDRIFGIRFATILFAVFIVLGQTILAVGAFTGNFPLMQFGRFVFGIGGESLAVAQNSYAVAWFKGKELNMVFGFQISITRVGSTVNFLAVGPLFHWLARNLHGDNQTALGWTFSIAGITCIMSLTCALILGWMDKRAECLLKSNSQEQEEVINILDVFTYPCSFWLMCGVALAYYVAIFPFISLGQVFFMKKYGFNTNDANFITGLIYLISAPASPLFGYLIDRTGRNVLYCFLSVMGTLVSHYILAFSFMNPYIPIFIMGICYSLLASALWPMAAYVVPQYQLGTAYGLMQAIQNIGLALCTMLCGLTVDAYGYIWLEIFFISWVVIALICTFGIWVIDINTSGYLNMGAIAREKFDCESEKLQLEAKEKERNEKKKLDNNEVKKEDSHNGYYSEGMRPRTNNEIRNSESSTSSSSSSGTVSETQNIL
uniref:Lysosomal dipeptide transporter MFSD1 n=1 Tax=Lepeophtheirus salmonis TaxID=72036 RepID=A0A0K2UWK7_LEPSM